MIIAPYYFELFRNNSSRVLGIELNNFKDITCKFTSPACNVHKKAKLVNVNACFLMPSSSHFLIPHETKTRAIWNKSVLHLHHCNIIGERHHGKEQ
jgi:hypothetical protein